jgi:phosphoglycolate phosphatase-like HAD superfamily hydrolase
MRHALRQCVEQRCRAGDVVGVATGSYSVEQLSEAGADYALSSVESDFPL